MVVIGVTDFFLLLHEVTVQCWSFPDSHWGFLAGLRRDLMELCRLHVMEVKHRLHWGIHMSGINKRRLKAPIFWHHVQGGAWAWEAVP